MHTDVLVQSDVTVPVLGRARQWKLSVFKLGWPQPVDLWEVYRYRTVLVPA